MFACVLCISGTQVSSRRTVLVSGNSGMSGVFRGQDLVIHGIQRCNINCCDLFGDETGHIGFPLTFLEAIIFQLSSQKKYSTLTHLRDPSGLEQKKRSTA